MMPMHLLGQDINYENRVSHIYIYIHKLVILLSYQEYNISVSLRFNILLDFTFSF